MSETLTRYEAANGVARLTFTRPEKKNALSVEMYQALTEACERARTDDAVGALIISGDGGDFCAGNDMANFVERAAASAGDMGDPEADPIMRCMLGLKRFPKPLIAAVEGRAIGFGATMLLHADFVYAGRSAQWKMPFVDLAIVPEAGSSQILVQQLGRVRAAEFLLAGEWIGAEALERYGLISAVTEDGEALAAAEIRAEALAAKPRQAMAATKALMLRDAEPLEARMIDEMRGVAARLGSDEARALFEAFFKRA